MRGLVGIALCAAGLVLATASCSVMMAAKQEGTSIDKVQHCRTRGQLLSCGGVLISSTPTFDGGLVEEYQFQKSRGSAARAIMHGALDLATGFVWEIVGTPMEACLNEQDFFVLRVTYHSDMTVARFELL